ncbi:MAG: hypothetical protein LBL93_00245 [Ruminococcus sp.]|nr:hypothetical protein [Ruminococcus sp.]
MTFIISIVYVVIKIISAPTVAFESDVSIRVKGDYVLMLLQCSFGLVAMLLPGYLQNKVRMNIPNAMMIAYAVFLFCAIYLGEVRDFYYVVPHWDVVLHIFSGAGLGALGFSVINLLNKSDTILFSLSNFFVALFAFCFAVTLGTVWEIYEFSVDFFLNTNMQKYALESGKLLVGKKAVVDTMKDLIVDAIGAFTVSATGYIAIRYKKGWFKRILIHYLNKENK